MKYLLKSALFSGALLIAYPVMAQNVEEGAVSQDIVDEEGNVVGRISGEAYQETDEEGNVVGAGIRAVEERYNEDGTTSYKEVEAQANEDGGYVDVKEGKEDAEGNVVQEEASSVEDGDTEQFESE